MKNFLKFQLKSEAELYNLIKEKEKISTIICKACYEELTDNLIEKQYNVFIQFLSLQKKELIDSLFLNFLCDTYTNKNKILEFSKKHIDIDSVCVLSCGIGIQFVSDILDGKIIAIADSIQPLYNFAAGVVHHGISLNNEKLCATCGQCYLNYTNVICPIVSCSKSLLNGPCGGAKNGKCEVDKTKECGWEKICLKNKLENTKLNAEIFLRNYNILTYSQQKKLIDTNLDLRIKYYYGCIHPRNHKEKTEHLKIKEFPMPNKLFLFLSQHIGKPSKPLVKQNEYIKKGQKIAQKDGFISSLLHSPVSGKVLEIKELLHPKFLKMLPAIVIENDFKESLSDTIKPHPNWGNLNKEQILGIIEEAGIVGLGGAMFPTYVKLSSNKPVNTLIINGCECEPYINADNRIMIENPDKLFEGINIIKHILSPKNTIIVVEDNKTQAIETIKKTKPQDIQLITVKTKYPHGAEKILIKKLFGINIPYDKIPLDFGFLVQNVSTVTAIYDAVVKGIPLIERTVSITGDEEIMKEYNNFKLKIGTPLKDIIDKCYNIPKTLEESFILKYAGFMTGIELKDYNTSIIKGCNGIVVTKQHIKQRMQNQCIKCGRCIDSCPMELEPLEFVRCFNTNNLKDATKYSIKSCIECGCCQYICSMKIPIVEIIKQEKIKCLH